VRAVEVIRLTGKPFSVQRAAWPDRAPAVAGRSFGLERSREELVRRIEDRVDGMFAAGLVDETRRLLPEGLAGNRTAAQAIGYRQVMEHLAGERGLRKTVEWVKARTRQYAKRQLTWFRQQLDLEWVSVEAGTSAEEVAMGLRGRLR
jgi:tRNA dimethylallyltransferase